MKKIKISIFGSCISRDNFNSKFIADWREYFTLCASHFQSSMLSITTEEIQDLDISYLEIDDYDKSWLKKETTKSFLQDIHVDQPEYIIFDFFTDAKFKCAKVRNSFITLNDWRLKNLNISKLTKSNLVFSFEDDELTFLENFKKSLVALRLNLRNNLPSTKIILNSSRAARFYFNGNQRIYFDSKMVEVFNKRLDILEGLFKEIFDPIVINLSSPSFPSDHQHPWGPYLFHYDQQYYRSFFSQLILKTGLNRNDDTTLKVNPYDQLKVKTYSDVRLTHRDWVKNNELFDNGLFVRINAPVYKSSYLLHDAMLTRSNGIIQTGEFHKNIWPEVSYQKGIYGGFLVDHYGHFVLESINRLWAYTFLKYPIFFQVPKGLDDFDKIPIYMRQVFEMLKIPKEKIILVNKKIAVGRLFVPERMSVLDGYIHPLFNKFYGVEIEESRSLGGKLPKIYLSRSRVNSSTGSNIISNEIILENFLLSNGFKIIHPQEHSVQEQVDLLSNCEVVIGPIGSSFHTLLLCKKMPKQIVYLVHTENINCNFPEMDCVLRLDSSYVKYDHNDIDFIKLKKDLALLKVI